jgi:glycosyltransferase involved in cell wall biosynthesis
VIGFFPLANMLGLPAADISGVRLRVAFQRSPGSHTSRLERLFDRCLGARGVYNRIVCVSHAVQDSFAAYPPAYRARLSVVNGGIDWMSSSLSKAEARASFGIPDAYPLLVATGRFAPQRNYDLMVRVMATTPRLRLAIAGDGKLRRAMETLTNDLGAENRIHFLGSLGRARIADLLRAGDGFVQTSLYEGQSNSVLEAMHEALPIICSDIPAQRETVLKGDGECIATLVPQDDFESWRTAFLRIRDGWSGTDEQRARMRTATSRRFALHRMADDFEAAVMEAERPKRTPPAETRATESADFIY